MISWVADHRKHHAFSDQEGDPHSPHVDHGDGWRGALRGLLHAHMGWLFIHTQRGNQRALRPRPARRPGRSAASIARSSSGRSAGSSSPFGLGWLIGGTVAAALTGLLWGGAVRLLVLHHVTYSINSLCHFFGRRRFETGDESRNLALAGAALLRRGVAQQPPRLPHVRRPRAALVAARHLGAGHPRRSRSAGLAWDVVRIRPGPPAKKLLAETPRSRWRSRSTAPLRGALAEALPERPSASSFWDGSELPATNGGGGPDASPCARRAPWPTRCAPPGSSGSAAPTCRGELEVDDIDAAIELLRQLAAAAAGRARPRPAWLLAAAARGGPRAPAARARRPSCAPQAAPALDRARPRARCATTTTSANEFFALFLDESMTYSCAIFSRGATTLEEAQETKLELVCTKLGLRAGRARARRRLRLGQLRGARRRRPRRPRHRHHAVRAPGRAARARAPRRPASPTASTSACRTTASCAGERFDAIASIGMVEHVGSVQIDAYAAAPARRCWSPAAACSTTASPACATATPRRGRSPSATSSPTRRRCTSRGCISALERAGLRDRPRRGLRAPTTPRRCATGRGASTRTSTRRVGLAGPERVRVWRLYLRAARHGFETGFTSIYQVVAERVAESPPRQCGRCDATACPSQSPASSTADREPAARASGSLPWSSAAVDSRLLERLQPRPPGRDSCTRRHLIPTSQVRPPPAPIWSWLSLPSTRPAHAALDSTSRRSSLHFRRAAARRRGGAVGGRLRPPTLPDLQQALHHCHTACWPSRPAPRAFTRLPTRSPVLRAAVLNQRISTSPPLPIPP